MRITIPFLPMVVEGQFSLKARWRPLPPFRFSLRSFVIAVAVAGLFASLCAQAVRLERASRYHADQAFQLTLRRFPNGPPFSLPNRTAPNYHFFVSEGATPLEKWHRKKAVEYTHAGNRLITPLIGVTILMVALSTLAVIGWVVHALLRPAFAPTADEPSRPLAGTRVGEAG